MIFSILVLKFLPSTYVTWHSDSIHLHTVQSALAMKLKIKDIWHSLHFKWTKWVGVNPPTYIEVQFHFLLLMNFCTRFAAMAIVTMTMNTEPPTLCAIPWPWVLQGVEMVANAVALLLVGCEQTTIFSWGFEAITVVAVAAPCFWWRNINGANPNKQPKVTPACWRERVLIIIY